VLLISILYHYAVSSYYCNFLELFFIYVANINGFKCNIIILSLWFYKVIDFRHTIQHRDRQQNLITYSRGVVKCRWMY